MRPVWLLFHLGKFRPYRSGRRTGESNAPAILPELQKGKFMSLNHHTPGEATGPLRQDSEEADVLEIYPGASTAPRVKPRSRMRLMGSEAGMATAEYAIATLAAVGFAGLLVFILRSDEVRGFLLNLIRTALALP
jgi:hypothetical protein